jgi:hypothetical protein
MTMTQAELDLLHARIDACTGYLEFGSGASTVYAAGRPSIRRIDSVESSAEFIDQRVRPEPAVSAAEAEGRLFFHIVDIGRTVDWGSPADDQKRHLWPNYPLSIFARPSEHDLVLVDGRFRVACTLASILSTPPGSTIMIHDFWIRPEYHVVLRFLDVQARADTLAVFSRKPNLDTRQVQAMLARYQYQPGDRPPAPTRAWNAIRRRIGSGGSGGRT